MSETIIGEKKYRFECERKRKHKVPRLKITATGLRLMLPSGTGEDEEKRYRRIAAAIFLKALEQGVPGALFGRFEHKYDGIVMTWKGKPYCTYVDRKAYEQDHPVVGADQVSLIQQATMQQTIALAQGQEVRLA